jgi:putative transposase
VWPVLVTQAYRFALDPTPAQERALASHAGAARFAYNWGLALVRDRLEARSRVRAAALVEQLPDAEVECLARLVEVPWTLAALRREWNRAKGEVAPWWPQNSKEAASSGLAYLAAALKGFSDSRHGRRAGRRVGFPLFKRRGRSRESYKYTTGSFGVSGRTRVQLPRVGHVRTHEPTTKLLAKVQAGTARVLSATVSREGARWFCSLCCEVDRAREGARHPESVVGLDVGVRQLAVLSTGELIENPRALARAWRALRRHQRRLDRQRRANNPGCYDAQGSALRGRRPWKRSKRQKQTEQRIVRLHARARNIHQDHIHKLTSRLAAEHGTIVVEQLNAAGLCRAGNRGLRRALHDASLAEIRRQLAYKTVWRGGTLIQAPTFYPSSKTCSACGTAKAKLSLSERTYRCERCGLVLDRDENAARNLAALATTVAGSGSETENARSPSRIRPGPAGRWLDREAGSAPVAHQTGTALRQRTAA